MDLYSLFDNSYMFIAIVGSTILVLQFILSLMGIGSGHEAGVDGADGDMSNLDSVDDVQMEDVMHVNLFSLKGIVSFFAFYGWGGVLFRHLGWGGFALAIGCGLLMMVLVSLLMALMLKMQQSGNIQSSDLIGKSGTVYLGIPAGRSPGGKITVQLPGCTREVAACSDDAISTGSPIEVVEALGNGVYLVKKK